MRAILRQVSFVLLLSVFLFGCAKETSDPETIFSSTAYNSPSFAEDVVLANVFNSEQGYHVYYYGSTDGNGSPQQVRGISFNRQGSDTIYNFLLDENLKIEFMYSMIGGVRDSKLQKLSYISPDSIQYALYDYNWQTQEDTLLYMAAVLNTDGNFTAETLYGKTDGIAWLPALQAIGGSLHTGGGVLAAVAVGVAGIAFFSAPAWLAAIGSITIATAWFGGSANASTYMDPGTGEPGSPSSGLAPNPIGTPTDPSPCAGVNITFNTNMDQFGSILITNPFGGYDLQYSLNGSPFQVSQVFDGPYEEGDFTISVKNGNGCIKTVNRYIAAYAGLQVGDAYQGGIVARILTPADAGYDPNIAHGLIAAPEDQSAAAFWGCYGGNMYNSLEYGDGYQNTEGAANLCPENPPNAAAICLELVLNGYSDWHLPSYNEMTWVILNRNVIGGFNTDPAPTCYYWASSAVPGLFNTYAFDAQLGGSVGWNRNDPARVRAVRYF